MKCILLVILLSIFTANQVRVSVEQVRADLKAVNTREQAKAYFEKMKLKGSILELDEIVDSSVVAMKLFKAAKGEVIEQATAEKSTYFYKILTMKQTESDRVQYIYFDNSKLSKKKIDSLRTLVAKKLKEGETFGALAKKYSMDQNGKRGGDSGWFDKEMFVGEFVTAVRAHTKNDVFNVDIPSMKWFYVIRKSHDPIKRKKIDVMQVVVPPK